MNIIVTGGSKGIGREIAIYLSQDKSNSIIITGRNKDSLEETARASKIGNISYIVTDFRKPRFSTDQIKRNIERIFKSVDILINNAGVLYSDTFSESTEEKAREMMEVNFFAPVFIIKALLPIISKGGHIVNISSMGGFQGSVKYNGLSFYSASKAAIACISECLAAEFKELGISVNSLALGSVQTEMLVKAFPGYRAPVTAADMGKFVGDFALTGNRYHNGKIIPVALTTP